MDQQPPTISDSERTKLGWRTATVSGVVLAVGLTAFVVLYAANGFLLIFAGVLFAVFLDALTGWMAPILPRHRSLRLAIVCIALTIVLVGFLTTVGILAAGQVPELLETLEGQIETLNDAARERGLGLNPNGGPDGALMEWLPDPSGLFGQVGAAFAKTFGVLGNVAIVVVLGVFLAAQPALYRDGLVRLVPVRSRERLRAVLDEIGRALRFWLIGQFVTMSIIGLIVWIALAAVGMPGAVILAVTAGLLNFIPVVGPILAGIPIVLVALSQGGWVVAYALGVYLAVQFLEGNVLTPLIQRRAVNLPPALVLTALVVMGILFGFVGIMLATPFAAVLLVAVKRFYIEDVLGDRA